MINMEIAKVMFKFNNQMLPDFFNNYSTKLDSVLNYNTSQKLELSFFNIPLLLNQGEKLFITSV